MTDTEWTKEYIEHRDRAADDILERRLMPMFRQSNMSTTAKSVVKNTAKIGFEMGSDYERERAKVLVEALAKYARYHIKGDIAREALAKYGENGEL